MTPHLILTLLCLVAALAVTTHADAGTPRHINPQREHVVRQLNAGLAGTPMSGTGRALEASGWKWRVSPFFIIGVSGKESSLGFRSCHSNRKNIWGLKSCGTGSYVDLDGNGTVESLPIFQTWAGAYDFFARYFRARHSYARTPWDIRNYCECDERQWASTVVYYMGHLFGAGPSVRYGG